MDEQDRDRDDRPADPRSGPVRIIGAHRAGGPAPEDVEADEQGTEDERSPAGFGPEDWSAPAEPALPHWTEAPTGEVPAVLSRPGADEDDDPWAAVPEPSWREEHADWDRTDSLDAALWPGAGGSRSPDEADAEREPWTFDLEGRPGEVEVIEEEQDDLFASWDTGAAASGSGWGDDAGGVPRPHDLEPGEQEPPPDGGPGWPSEGEPWDPDVVAGEKTTVMRLPEPPDMGTGALPPPPAAHARAEPAPRDAFEPGEPGGIAEEPFAGGPLADEPLEEPTGDEALEQEALAADLEARRAGWRRGGREAATPGPVLQPRAVGEPAAGRGLAVPGGPARPGGPGPGRGTASRLGDDLVSQRTGRNIPVAIASGLVIGALALVAFHFGTVPSMVVVTAVLGLAAVEAFGAFRRAGYHPATLLGLVAVVGLIVGAYDKGEQAFPLVAVLLVAATFVWHLAGVDRRAEPVRSTAATVLVFGWVGVFGAFAALLLAPSLFPDRHGIAYLLGALIAAVAYDVGALAAGAWLGRRPLSSVSPGKTWEGVVGGAVAALVLSVAVVHLIHPWNLERSVALGVVVAVVSPIGDLCESMVKRQLGLKDMGRILPGHGGLLDRVDGLLFVLPATFYLVRAFHG